MPATTDQPTAPVSSASDSPGFVHLHLHTEYSLLDGGNRIDKLCDRVKELGMPAVACTDHGNLFGAVAFYQAAKDRGLKPILGIEAYVAQGSRRDRTYTGNGDGGFHLVLLAETDEGWRNLVYLSSESYLTGFYFKPRVDRELLATHNAGLIAINGHLGSEIGDHLLAYERTKDETHWRKAYESAVWHAKTFGPSAQGQPRFFIELQHHIHEQNSINPHLVRLARELKLPLVCDNDAHFLRAGDHDAHDTLICISTGRAKSEPDRMKYPPQVYVKSPAEMHEIFEPYGDVGAEALANTAGIAARCNVTLPIGVSHAPMVRVKRRGDTRTWDNLPRHNDPSFGGDLTAWYKAYCAEFEVVPFSVDAAATDAARAASLAEAKAECDAALRRLSEAGTIWRYGPTEGAPGAASAAAEEIASRKARLERELKILADKQISAYFLIVWDFVNWGRQQGIPALARGSGVGTMVGYVMGLSNACPVRYGLLFERFTDPDRSEYPDIDIDLCQDGRSRVIDYVRRKYGHVAQIITFGTLKARAAIRDVGRVLEIPLSEVDRIAKLVPEQLGITLDKALEQEPDLRELYDRDELVRRLLDNARAIEGQARHASVHAAGVIVATRPLHEIVPLYRPSGKDKDSANGGEQDVVTQWDGPTCEKMGLLKMDFLGLRTLSVIERAKRLIREGLSEEQIWAAVGRGDEYRAMSAEHADSSLVAHRSSLVISHPLDLDRIAPTDQKVFEMFRRADCTGVFQFESPGMRRMLLEMKPDRLEDLIAANALFRPGPMDLIPDYNRRKHGQDKVPKLHPIVDQYTAETYGVMVYQEQVMQIVHGLGGIKLRDAYSLIKNISKKKHDKIEKERPKFIEGAQKQGLTRDKAQELFELILKFAGYGFNKSHSTGYAIVAYQTAYLKTYFPNQYMAAFLTFESAAMQTADWVPYLEDCKTTRFIDPVTAKVLKTGVEVRPPDVNLSQAEFAVVFTEGEAHTAAHGHVRFGLRAIKGVGDRAIDSIIREREGAGHQALGAGGEDSAKDEAKPAPKRKPYSSIFDFCERVPIGGSAASVGGGGSVNKATIEALIKSGAMDCLHGRPGRSAMVASLEAAVAAGIAAHRDRAAGQGGLFGGGGFGEPAAKTIPVGTLTRSTPWNEQAILAAEKEVLGFYVSSHPLDQHSSLIARFANASTKKIRERQVAQDMRVTLGGLIQSVRTLVVKSGKSIGAKMGVVSLEDKEGSIEAVAFSDVFGRHVELIVPDRAVFVVGKVDLTRGEPQLIIEKIVPIADAETALARRVRLTLDETRLNGHAADRLEQMAAILKAGSNATGGLGGLAVDVVVRTDSADILLEAPRMKIALNPKLFADLASVLGEGSVVLAGTPAPELVKSEPKKWEKRAGGGRD